MASRRSVCRSLVAASARALGLAATVSRDLDASVQKADVISCCTLSQAPLVRGAKLSPGAHLDLIGAFKPSMRESDDEAMRRATIFVDTFDGALKEGGDIVIPLNSGVISRDDIVADLFGLTRGEHPGRTSPTEITAFKSVGTGLEDLAAAALAFRLAG